VCVRERVSELVCGREIVRERKWVCVREKAKEYVCVCVREREGETVPILWRACDA